MILNAVRGPWRVYFVVAVAVAMIVAVLGPNMGWSGEVSLGVAFIVIVAAAFVTGYVPIVVGTHLMNKGVALFKAGKYDEAIAVFDSYAQRIGENHLHGGRIALAMEWKGAALAKSRRPEEAAAIYDDLVERFTKSRYSAVRKSAATARAEREALSGSVSAPSKPNAAAH